MTDDEKRALLAQRNKAVTDFLLCPPNDPRESELRQSCLDLDRRCREVFGTIPAKV